jgi:transcriptional regulator with XRE-family HTH domain
MPRSRSSAPRPRSVRGLEGLRKRLRQARISQAMIAEKAGVSRPAVSLVLSGRAKSQRILEIARAMVANPDGVGRPLGRWGKRHLEWLADVIRKEKHRCVILMGGWWFL